MGDFLSVLVLGVSYGLVLFLLATGMTLTMGLLRVVNMSHGAIYMFAGFCGVWVYKITGNWLLAVLGGALVGGLLGFLLETIFLRKLYRTPTNQVLLTIGIIYIIQNITQWIWGGLPANAPVPSFLIGGFQVGNVTIPYFRIFIIVFGVIMAVAIWLMQEKTKLGAMVRAGMDNGVISGTMGINTKQVFTLTFVIGSLIAGMSSMVGGSLTGLSMGTCWSVLLHAIIVVVIGGAGSIPGALIGGLVIGLVNSFGAVYVPALSSYLIYIVLIIVLLVRPQGIMGRKMDINRVSDTYAQTRAVVSIPKIYFENGANRIMAGAYRFGPYAVVLIALAVFPFVGSQYTTSIMTEVLIFALFAVSLDILMGFIGNRSFGHAAFFGMGAYCVALMAKLFDIKNFWIVLPVTIAVCAVLSVIIGYLTLHLSGTNFLLVTMAFGQLLNVVATKWQSLTNGTDGISAPRPDMGFLSGIIGKWNGIKIYFLVLIIFVICFMLISRFMKASFGTSLKGIKDNEGRMMALGFNTRALRFAGFVISGIFAGIAGMLYAYAKPTVDPNIFGLESSALPMLMVIMGGSGTLWGPALGALVIVLVKNYSGILFAERWPLVLGIIYVLCVMFFAGGFAPYLKRVWIRIGRKLFPQNNKLNTKED